MKLAFVEEKHPDMSRIAGLLGESAAANRWANRGPVYCRLREMFAEHIALPPDLAIVPVANGGVALEAMARHHAKLAGRKLKWVASAFSFQNLGRGYFSKLTLVDCDQWGRLDQDALSALSIDSYDGIIVTNPFGIISDFSALAAFAAKNGKACLIDNASGLHSRVPAIPWQSFSLHHTKPYGMGEGGLAILPRELEEEYYSLVNYAPEISSRDRVHWLGNGKLSDISAAFLIDRLEQLPQWRPRSLEQRERVIEIARHSGLKPLCAPDQNIPMTSMPLLAPNPVPLAAIETTSYATYAKYYRPLANLPRVNDIYAHIINVPCHGDVADLSDSEIEADILHCLEASVSEDHSRAIWN